MGVTQTIETPVPTPTAASVPTAVPSLPTAAPSPFATPTMNAQPTAESGNVITDPTLVKLIADAKADLAQSANVAVNDIKVKSAEPVEWSDSSLGCPQPGMMYAQVITPGYLIVLDANGNEYEYHASTAR